MCNRLIRKPYKTHWEKKWERIPQPNAGALTTGG